MVGPEEMSDGVTMVDIIFWVGYAYCFAAVLFLIGLFRK